MLSSTESFFTFSNQNLLIFTTTLFGIFVLSEIAGGLIANSLSLLGDATAMSVDVLTYIGNIYAEYLKQEEGRGRGGLGLGLSGNKNEGISNQKTIIITEVIIPSISLIALIGVSIWVSIEASLRLRGHKEEEVELSFLFIFPIANFLVDIFCALLFYLRRHDIFHHHTQIQITSDYDFSVDFSESSSDSSGSGGIELSGINHHLQESRSLVSQKSYSFSQSKLNKSNFINKDEENQNNNNNNNKSNDNGNDNNDNSEKSQHEVNVNMLSAFTHISGDTLRTLATFIAAGISWYYQIDPSICDAWAAIIVSTTILISSLPLVYSIYSTIFKIYQNKIEEINHKNNNIDNFNVKNLNNNNHDDDDHNFDDSSNDGK